MSNETDRLIQVMARLRDPQSGCPWDIEQTFETIAPYTIEEAYEVADAIEEHCAGRELTGHSFPSVWDGVLGVRFVDAVTESQRQNGAWVEAGLSLPQR